MQVEYILNELSVSHLLASIKEAEQAMDLFVDVLKESRSIGIKPSIRAHLGLKEIQLAQNYFVSNWCSDQNISKEKRLYIQTLLTKSPLLEGISEKVVLEISETCVKHQNQVGQGMTVAYLTDNPILSLNTHEKWQPEEILVDIESLKVLADSNEIEIITTEANLINFCSKESLSLNKEKVRSILEKRFFSVDDFWIKKEAIFTNLEFSESVKNNLDQIGIRNPLFFQVVRKLVELNKFCEDWTEGPCEILNKLANVSPESKSTMQQFQTERIFNRPNGEAKVCELHMRATPGAIRIHFCPLIESRTMFIGYVGEKLSTVSDRT